MKNVTDLIETFETKIKDIEKSIQNASNEIVAWTKNHTAFLGMLQGTKDALEETKKVMDAVEPEHISVEPEHISVEPEHISVEPILPKEEIVTDNSI